jgi:hypothetical protein
MTAVMPSQVVITIDQLFPTAKEDVKQTYYDMGHMSPLRGILNLSKEVPRELLAVSEGDYADFVLARSTIETQIALWTSRGEVGPMRLVRDGFDAVTILRRVLAKCSDEYPPVAHTDLAFVSVDELRLELRRDIGGIERSLAGGEWKAATVLAGATIEALLHWKLSQLDKQTVSAAFAARGFKGAATPDELDGWSLTHLFLVAGDLKLISSSTVTAVGQAKDFRNLIHPGLAARQRTPCSRGTAYAAVGAMNFVIEEFKKV